MDSWYRHGLMVFITPMALTQNHGIVSVLLNHTHTRGPSVAHKQDFLICSISYFQDAKSAKNVQRQWSILLVFKISAGFFFMQGRLGECPTILYNWLLLRKGEAVGGSCLPSMDSFIIVANYRFWPKRCRATSILLLKYKKEPTKSKLQLFLVRETVPLQNSDMGCKTLSFLAHSLLLP